MSRFWPTVIRTRIAPIGVRAVVVIEVDAPIVIPVAPTIKAPKIEIAGTEVVVNQVHDHRDSQRMRCFHKPLKARWAAQRRFDREGV